MESTADSDLENLSASPPPVLQSQSPVNRSEIQDYLNEFQYASEPSYFTRPNRYHGPPSTWRSWTANDRVVAESLNAVRASDLSIHLYNAFDLKERSRSAPHARRYDTKLRSRDRVASDEDQQIVNQEFTPPESWTAWPLRSHHVPRNLGPFDADDDVRTRSRKIKPSMTLEDALLATTLRHARKRWEARKNEPNHSQTGPIRHSWKSEHDPEIREANHSTTAQQEEYNSASARSGDREVTPDSDRDLNVGDDVLMDETLPEGVQFFSSQAFAAVDSSSLSEDEMPPTNSEEDYPVFSADDDLAYSILRPSIRHMLAKFDDLLDGLHKARAAYALKGDNASSRSRSRTVFSEAEITEDDRLVRSGSRAAVKKQGRKRKLSANSSDPEQLQQSTSRGRSTVRVSDKKNQACGLRDWSDVLGMATLTGWNVETVARASERCAKLFNQNMTFRTFHQGSVDGKAASQEGPWFEEEVAYAPIDAEGDTQNRSQSSPSRGQTEKWQKIEYIRTSSRCSRCQHNKIRCLPPKSMSTVDPTQPVACAACSSSPNLDAPCPGITIRPRTKSTSKTCPYPDCARHDLTKPFAKNYHLQRHLTDVHGHIYSPPTSPVMNDHASDDQFNMTTEEQIRPSATLTCPITSCPQSTRIYKRSTRLYGHIRKAHPEFDVASFKKIVGKNGGRGRYDRSRSRSQGQAPAQDDEEVVDSVEQHEAHSEDEAEQPMDLGDSAPGGRSD